MIFFDCERLKHPNTGLYHYCLNLANAMARQADRLKNRELCVYVHDDKRYLLDSAVKVKKVRGWERALLYDSRINCGIRQRNFRGISRSMAEKLSRCMI